MSDIKLSSIVPLCRGILIYNQNQVMNHSLHLQISYLILLSCFSQTHNFLPVLSAIYENRSSISLSIFHFQHWV